MALAADPDLVVGVHVKQCGSLDAEMLGVWCAGWGLVLVCVACCVGIGIGLDTGIGVSVWFSLYTGSGRISQLGTGCCTAVCE